MGGISHRAVNPAAGIDQTGFNDIMATNPAAGTIVTRTGNLPAGLYEFVVVMTGNVSWEGRVQVLDSADVLKDHIAPCKIPNNDLKTFGGKVTLLVNEEIAVENEAGVTGLVYGGLIWWRLKA